MKLEEEWVDELRVIFRYGGHMAPMSFKDLAEKEARLDRAREIAAKFIAVRIEQASGIDSAAIFREKMMAIRHGGQQ